MDNTDRAEEKKMREIKNPNHTQSLSNNRAQGRRASKKSGGIHKETKMHEHLGTNHHASKSAPNTAGIKTDALVTYPKSSDRRNLEETDKGPHRADE